MGIGLLLGGGGAGDNDTFDVDIADITKYSVGQEVEITIKGCIGMVSIPPEPGMGNPKIGVKVTSQEIKKTGTIQDEELRKLVEGDMNDYSGEDY